MQTQEDASRIVAIGAAPESVHVGGNLKYEITPKHSTLQQKKAIRKEFRIPPGTLVFTAASTHEGEEEPVIDAYQALLKCEGAHFLVLAPRHPERAPAVAALLAKRGIPFRLRSAHPLEAQHLFAGEALLLDSVGELAKLFAVSDLVFMGGSLVPKGGHNPLEPASCGVPVLFGPHTQNFREITALFLRYGAGIQVPDAKSLGLALISLAGDTGRRAALGRQGLRIIEESSGATARHLEVVADSLAGKRGSEHG
jgi:3-deoxy-D-manno-octulosonic-acid transferase